MTTDAEKRVVDHLAEAWNEFLRLPLQHPSEREEFIRGIHVCQHIVACRVAQRADPETWPIRSAS